MNEDSMPLASELTTDELMNELKARNHALIYAAVPKSGGAVAMTGSGGLHARSWLADVLIRVIEVETDSTIFNVIGDDDDDDDGEADA